MIIVLTLLCLFLIRELTKSHLKVHRLNKTLKMLWSDLRHRRVDWTSAICNQCKQRNLSYNGFEEYLEVEVCWLCRKKKSSPDTGILPTCLDCYGYQYGLEGIEFLEEQGFSVIERGD